MVTSAGFIVLAGFPAPDKLGYLIFNPENVPVPNMKRLLESPTTSQECMQNIVAQYFQFQNLSLEVLNGWKVVARGLITQFHSRAVNTECQITIDLTNECVLYHCAYVNTGNRRNLEEERLVWYQFNRMLGFLEQSISKENSKKMGMSATPTLPRLADGAVGIQDSVLGSTALTPTDQTPSPTEQLCGLTSPTTSFQSTFNYFSGSVIPPNIAPMTPEKMGMFATPTLPRLADGPVGIQDSVLGSTALSPTYQTPSPTEQLCVWPSPTTSFQSTSNCFSGSSIFPSNTFVPMTPGTNQTTSQTGQLCGWSSPTTSYQSTSNFISDSAFSPLVPMTPSLFSWSAPNLLLTLMPQNCYSLPVLQHLHTSKAVTAKNTTQIQPYKREKEKMAKIIVPDSWKEKHKEMLFAVEELNNNESTLKALVKCFNSFKTYHNLSIKYISSVTEIPQRQLGRFFDAFQSGIKDWQIFMQNFNKVITWIYFCHQYDEVVPGLEKSGSALELEFTRQLKGGCTPKKKRELESDLLNLETFIRTVEKTEKRKTYQPHAEEILALARQFQLI